MIRSIDLVQGRHLFGKDPAQYDRVRPGYPAEVYRVLRRRCGLSPGTATFEIGAGTGKATRELLRRGASPLAVVEPDPRCARYLRSSLRPWRDRVRLYVAPFEDVELEEGGFDLGVAATSFHWLRERPALGKVVRFLRPGGWWAMWSNLHGDPTRPTDFTRAVDPLYRGFEVSPVTGSPGPLGFRTYRDERLATLRGVGGFDRASCRVIRWKRTLDTDTVLALNRTFSNISSLPYRRRERFLSELRRVVDGPFGGRVTLNMLTTLFTARRTEHGPGG